MLGTTQHSLYGRSSKGRGGGGVLGEDAASPLPTSWGLRERCKLPQWRSPGRNRFWCISKLVEGIKSKRCVICFCVSNFPMKFRGCSNTQNTPLVTALGQTDGRTDGHRTVTQTLCTRSGQRQADNRGYQTSPRPYQIIRAFTRVVARRAKCTRQSRFCL